MSFPPTSHVTPMPNELTQLTRPGACDRRLVAFLHRLWVPWRLPAACIMQLSADPLDGRS